MSLETNKRNDFFKRALSFKDKEDKFEFEAETLSIEMMDIVANVLEEKSISQKDFAAQLGVSPSFLSQLFSGDKILNLKMIVKINHFLTNYLDLHFVKKEKIIAKKAMLSTIQLQKVALNKEITLSDMIAA